MTYLQLRDYAYRTARKKGLTVNLAKQVRATVANLFTEGKPTYRHLQMSDLRIQQVVHAEIDRALGDQ